MESVHKHDIQKMIVESGKAWDREGLLAEIKSRFGAEQTFHTCSYQGLTAEQVVEIMAQQGQIADPQKACSHDGAHGHH